MATYRPLVLVSGTPSELPINSDLSGGTYQLNTITAGSGLSGGGTIANNIVLDVELSSAASGLYFDASSRLGIDGRAQASGNAGISVGVTALASGNAGLTVGGVALASGNAGLARAVASLALTGDTMQGPVTLSGLNPTTPALRSNSNTGVYASGNYIGISASGVGQLLVGPNFVQIDQDTLRIKTSKTPASASASGVTGDIAWDSSYFYVCTSTNTWRRAALNLW